MVMINWGEGNQSILEYLTKLAKKLAGDVSSHFLDPSRRVNLTKGSGVFIPQKYPGIFPTRLAKQVKITNIEGGGNPRNESNKHHSDYRV